MRDIDYINVQGWMVSKLKLKGNELMIFAVIHGYSQDGVNKYRGSISYIAKFMSISRRSVVTIISKLVDKEYILKEEKSSGNLYQSTYERGGEKSSLVKKVHLTSEESSHVTSEESSYNINNNTNHSNDIQNPLILKNKNEKKSTKKIFENSSFNDYDAVKNYLIKNQNFVEKYRGADLNFYIDSVLTWSDKSGKKTTDRGWIAYIRQFMNSDIEKNKLVLKQKEERKKEVVPEKALKQGIHVNH